jgi:hypothetical protein
MGERGGEGADGLVGVGGHWGGPGKVRIWPR